MCVFPPYFKDELVFDSLSRFYPFLAQDWEGRGGCDATTLQCDATKHGPLEIFPVLIGVSFSIRSTRIFIHSTLSQQTDMPKICASVVDREVALDDGFKLLINNFAGLDA